MEVSAEHALQAAVGGQAEAQFVEPGQVGAVIEAFDAAVIQLISIHVDEPVNGWKVATFTYRAKQRDYIDRHLRPFLTAAAPRTVLWRLGLTAGERAQWRSWEEHVVVGVRVAEPADLVSGPLVTVKLADRLWLLSTACRIKSHRGAVSDLVKSMWEAAGGTSFVIEPTGVIGHAAEVTLYQAGESDWDFLARCLLPRAANAAGSSGYRLFVRDNALHCYSVEYGARTRWKLSYSAGVPGFDQLAIEDRSLDLAPLGSLGVERAVYDPITGTAFLAVATESTPLLASQRPAWYRPTRQIGHAGINVGLEQVLAQHARSAYGFESYRLELTATRCLDLRVGDFVWISFKDTARGSVSYEGWWLVSRATLTVFEGALSGTYALVRNAVNAPSSREVLDPGVQNLSASSVSIKLQLQESGGGQAANSSPGWVSASVLSPQ